MSYMDLEFWQKLADQMAEIESIIAATKSSEVQKEDSNVKQVPSS